jgi:hypothetical protein
MTSKPQALTDSERAELRKRIIQAEKRTSEYEAKIVEIKRRIAHFEKAKAALYKFYASGPHPKKKSGRPGFWKSPPGLSFVWEVEEIAKERKCKTVAAVLAARKQTVRRAKRSQRYGTKSPAIEAATVLEEQSRNELQVRYQEARKYWFFLIDPKAYQKEREILEYNFEQPLAALQETPEPTVPGLPRFFVRNSDFS